MNINTIGYTVTIIFFWQLFGWKGLLFAAFFGLLWFAPSQKTTSSSNAFPFFLWSDSKKSKNKSQSSHRY